MKTTTTSNGRLGSGTMIESLENRALMSAALGGLDGGTSLATAPHAGTTSLLLPAVQKVREAAVRTTGIIGILIGL